MLLDDPALRRAFVAGFLSALHRLRAKQRTRETETADIIEELESEVEQATETAARCRS